MSPEVEQLIEEWRDYNTTMFNRLVALVQKEAVNGILSRIAPQTEPVEINAPVQEQQSGPKKTIAQLQAEREARRQQRANSGSVASAPVEHDLNYGALGSAAVSTGSTGAVVTEAEEE